MKNSKGNAAIIAIFLAILMISSMLLISKTTKSAQAITTEYGTASGAATTDPMDTWKPGTDYGDVMRYDWPSLYGQYQPSGTGSFRSYGPAPNSPDMLFEINMTKVLPGISLANYLYAFNGKLFSPISTGGGGVVAFDALTGAVLWVHSGLQTVGSDNPAIWKIADNLMVYNKFCLAIDTGASVWNATPVLTPAGRYAQFDTNVKWPGGPEYDPTTHIFMQSGRSTAYLDMVGWDLSDPTQPPKVLWDDYKYYQEMSTPQYGDGVFAAGSYEGVQAGFNATTGKLIWETETLGEMGYEGTYYRNMFIRGGTTDNTITAFDRLTGEIKWTFNPQKWMGFFACAPAAAYGMVYYLNVDGYLYAVDAATGQEVWEYKGAQAYLGWPIVADGKVIAQTCMNDAMDYLTGEYYGTNRLEAVDAFTGKLIWTLPYGTGSPYSTQIVAFGNIYFKPEEYSGIIWCIGKPKDFTMWRNGPTQPETVSNIVSNLNVLWKYTTGGAVISSPAVVDGKVYYGSQDKYLYCSDAYTGALIWKTAIASRIRSSPAVVGGKVYLGPDDGYIHCFDANTGAELWKKDCGVSDIRFDAGNEPIFHDAGPPFRSSPIVVGGKVYVGSLSNRTYCFDAATGTQLWSFTTQGQVLSSPVVISNDLYVTCYGNGSIYKLDATTGTLQKIIWVPGTSGSYVTTNVNGAGTFMYPSPTIVGDGANRVIYYSAQNSYWYALNDTTGGVIWRWRLQDTSTRNEYSMVFDPVTKFLFVIDQYFVRALDTANVTYLETAIPANANPPAQYGRLEPNVAWSHYNSREVQGSITLGRFGPASGVLCYSTDSRIIYIVNASNGVTLSSFDDNGLCANGWSTPALWEGKMYIGNTNHNLYVFSDQKPQKLSILVSVSDAYPKVNTPVTITGQISPAVPNVPTLVRIIKPDKSEEQLNATADASGAFSVSYTPTTNGTYGVTAYWNGYKTIYGLSYSDMHYITVSNPTAGPTTPTPTATPPPTGTNIPIEYVYAAVAAIAIVIIAIGVYAYTRRGKKPAA